MTVSTQGHSDGNVDPREVQRFAEIAETWWDPNGPFRPLHKIGPARLSFIRNALARHYQRDSGGVRILDGLKILDVGCGGGLICEPLARLGAQVTGIDPAEESISAAEVHANINGLDIDYRAARIEQIASSEERFDAVMCLEVVEHVPDPAAFISLCATALKPGGLMIASTLNRTLKSFALAIVAAEYVLGWVDRGTHRWDRFVTPDELQSALENAGLTDVRFEGVVYNPLEDRWSTAADTDVNYMAAALKPHAT
ncbi:MULTISPECIES: bifunctional 2-polyprenyl-6-hydroxyphenol methylase/3-demethylubiquinol 3-O-methyltransferase UbiG [Filomicrobium]|uniref:Ubiquinone biosynthesis O-methyltransferase n=1 Tax=Filomicrobium insigne TaxID=418854 RepID=A0A1H0IRR7_9HYPH|nr:MULTISPECIES: bifunctional 2-polyprenyl-6-hydroxyphenol methylase/3-demethylubiquinol 3-O-methyltransferase UbiG [Filomicrobium]MCV0368321.1 bifunctional 2-polyprenyl-6-hydroxyphenol methylase/3-demethylubiquinol 3-O-methyltransferase UbiG [Filomicrobium sp.]SDO34169.1 3-demethylubiquinone-9 3-methyltransferase [Filomicrobium insigne]